MQISGFLDWWNWWSTNAANAKAASDAKLCNIAAHRQFHKIESHAAQPKDTAVIILTTAQTIDYVDSIFSYCWIAWYTSPSHFSCTSISCPQPFTIVLRFFSSRIPIWKPYLHIYKSLFGVPLYALCLSVAIVTWQIFFIISSSRAPTKFQRIPPFLYNLLFHNHKTLPMGKVCLGGYFVLNMFLEKMAGSLDWNVPNVQFYLKHWRVPAVHQVLFNQLVRVERIFQNISGLRCAVAKFVCFAWAARNSSELHP